WDEKDQPQRYITSNPIERIKGGEVLALEVTSQGQSRLAHLRYVDHPTYEVAEQRGLRLRSIETSAIPDRWHGLASADILIWDDPDLSTMQPDQLAAVVQWVQQGGRLVLTAGKNWASLTQSKLADLLPVRISGVRQARARDELLRLCRDKESTNRALKDKEDEVTRCVMQARGGAASGIWPYPSAAGEDPPAYRREYGRGVVTFVGAPLRELMRPLPVPRGDRKREAYEGDDEANPKEYNNDTYRESAAVCRELLQGLLPLPDLPRPGDN